MPVQHKSKSVPWGKRTQARKSQGRIMSWVTQTSPYHSQPIYPTPNKIWCNFPLCIEKRKVKYRVKQTCGAYAPKIHQDAGGFDFPDAAGSEIGISSVTPLSTTGTPSILLELDAPANSISRDNHKRNSSSNKDCFWAASSFCLSLFLA